MGKLLVITPDGKQAIHDVGPDGGYFDESRVLWDDRKHGPMPDVQLGGMEAEDLEVPKLDLQGNPVLDVDGKPVTMLVRKLKLNSAKLSAYLANDQKEKQDKAKRAQKIKDRKDSLMGLYQELKTPANQARLQSAIVLMLEELLQSDLNNSN